MSFQELLGAIKTMRIIKELMEIWLNEVCDRCFTLYTKFTFFGIRVSVIGAILVCLSITLVILEQA